MALLLKKVFLCLLFSFFFSFVQAQEASLVSLGESKHFSLYGQRGIDIATLIEKINFNSSDWAAGRPTGSLQNPREIFKDNLDALLLEVSQILGIKVPRFKGTIKFGPNQRWVSSVFQSYTGKSFPERSFYLYEKNTIYISSEDITLGMLGHEIAHAIMCSYFVAPPSPTIQEVLAGYVEYNLTR